MSEKFRQYKANLRRKATIRHLGGDDSAPPPVPGHSYRVGDLPPGSVVQMSTGREYVVGRSGLAMKWEQPIPGSDQWTGAYVRQLPPGEWMTDQEWAEVADTGSQGTVNEDMFAHPDPWMDNEPGTLTLPADWRRSHSSHARTADYEGWSNWDTWHVALMMDNDYETYTKARQIVDQGGGPQQLAQWANTAVIAPYNKQQIADAQEWNDIPEHDRLDHHYEDLKERNPQAADLVNGLGFGPDVSDEEPQLMDPGLVNWDEIYQTILSEYEEDDKPLPVQPQAEPQVPQAPATDPDQGQSDLTLPAGWQ